MPERPLQHREPDKKDDETLQKEARAHLGGEPALQLVAELITKLREINVPWWSPLRLREHWGAVERMRWFRERDDLRQHITTALTGLAPKAARRKAPDFQGALLDSVIDDGDIALRVFEEAFRPQDLAVYGPAGAYWHFFRESMPWDQDSPVHRELMAWFLKSLLADRSPHEGLHRKPILTPWDVRTAIDGRVWHTRMPLEIRVAVDDARLQQERDQPTAPFHASNDLEIALPEIIAASVPLRDLLPVFLVAQQAMRFEPPGAEPATQAVSTMPTAPRIKDSKPAGPAEPRPNLHNSPTSKPPSMAIAPFLSTSPAASPFSDVGPAPLAPASMMEEPTTVVPPPPEAQGILLDPVPESRSGSRIPPMRNTPSPPAPSASLIAALGSTDSKNDLERKKPYNLPTLDTLDDIALDSPLLSPESSRDGNSNRRVKT